MNRPDGPKCPTTGKLCFSKAEAHAQAKAARWRTLGGQIFKYRCDDWQKHPAGAGHYHIGHRPSMNTRKRRGYRVRPL